MTNSQTLSLKRADSNEIPRIISLANQIWPVTYREILPPDQILYMMNMIYSPEALRRQMEAEAHQFFILEENGSARGFASYADLQKSDKFKLHKIYVLPGQQGKGLGKFFLEAIMERIRQQGGSALLLNVNRYNKAKQFYEKLGFYVIREEDIDIGNNYFMNDFVMNKDL
ncbi:MAG: GNAT family N-acetyltransferase [Chitinophagales bacterium]